MAHANLISVRDNKTKSDLRVSLIIRPARTHCLVGADKAAIAIESYLRGREKRHEEKKDKGKERRTGFRETFRFHIKVKVPMPRPCT